MCLCLFLMCSPFDAAAAPGVWPFAVVSLPDAPACCSSLSAALPFLHSNASKSSGKEKTNDNRWKTFIQVVSY